MDFSLFLPNMAKIWSNYWQLFLLLAPAWIVVYLASRLRKRPDKEKNA